MDSQPKRIKAAPSEAKVTDHSNNGAENVEVEFDALHDEIRFAARTMIAIRQYAERFQRGTMEEAMFLYAANAVASQRSALINMEREQLMDHRVGMLMPVNQVRRTG